MLKPPYDRLFDDIKYGDLDSVIYHIRDAAQERITKKENDQPFEDLRQMLKEIEAATSKRVEERAQIGSRMFHTLKKYVESDNLAVRGFAKGVQAEAVVKLLDIRVDQVESLIDGVGKKLSASGMLCIIDNSGSVLAEEQERMDVHIQTLAKEGATLMVLDGQVLRPVSLNTWRGVGRGGCFPPAAAEWLAALKPNPYTRVFFVHDGKSVEGIPDSWTQVVVDEPVVGAVT